MRDKVVDKYFFTLKYFLDRYKTHKICDKAVDELSLSIEICF